MYEATVILFQALLDTLKLIKEQLSRVIAAGAVHNSYVGEVNKDKNMQKVEFCATNTSLQKSRQRKET